MNRVPAFSLLEVILSLLLVSLLGVFAFYILRNLQGDWRSMGVRAGTQEEVLFFSTALRTDLDQANAVRSAPEGTLVCTMDSAVVSYTTGPEGIRRSEADGRTDFFSLPGAVPAVYYTDASNSLVKLFTVRFADPTLGTLSFHKPYSPAELIHHSRTNGH
ncbi:MAG: hypothetical protein KDC00_11075 [Flavobacteriales bacterium]|nr:hypothetical protein [Flavobacteriales bacterium]